MPTCSACRRVHERGGTRTAHARIEARCARYGHIRAVGRRAHRRRGRDLARPRFRRAGHADHVAFSARVTRLRGSCCAASSVFLQVAQSARLAQPQSTQGGRALSGVDHRCGRIICGAILVFPAATMSPTADAPLSDSRRAQCRRSALEEVSCAGSDAGQGRPADLRPRVAGLRGLSFCYRNRGARRIGTDRSCIPIGMATSTKYQKRDRCLPRICPPKCAFACVSARASISPLVRARSHGSKPCAGMDPYPRRRTVWKCRTGVRGS